MKRLALLILMLALLTGAAWAQAWPVKPLRLVVPFPPGAALPAVPTMEDAGLKNFEVTAWYGLAAPAGTPAEVLNALDAALQKVAEHKDSARAMEAQGATVGHLNRNIFGAYLAAEATKWRKVIAFANIKTD